MRTRCDAMSPDTLSTRLRELETAGLVENGEAGWTLTSVGRRLEPSLVALDRWAQSWARTLDRG